MVKNSSSQVRPDWPTSSQRVRKRRESKVTYHNNPKPLHRNGAGSSIIVPPSGTSSSSSRSNLLAPSPVSPLQPVKSEFLDLYEIQGLNGPYYESPQQVDPAELWSYQSSTTYTLPSRPPHSPQTIELGFPSQDRDTASPSTFQSNPQLSWQKGVTPTQGNYNNINLISPADSQFGSYDSFDSMGMPSGNTTASSVSDTYACPAPDSAFEPSGRTNQLQDLALSESYFQTKQPSYDVSPTSSINSTSGVFPFESDFNNDLIMSDWSLEDQYIQNENRWSQVTITQSLQNQNNFSENTPVQSHSPWNSQSAHNNNFDSGAIAGGVAFEPARGSPYETYLLRQQILEPPNQPIPEVFVPEPSPILESENEWHHIPSVVPSYPNSSIRSHESPRSEGSSPWTHVDSPPASSASPQSQPDQHYHIISAYPGLSSPKLPRGRQRALTSQEKKEALDVRKAKACWACHLSKIKCSPCSPGSPCQQCERLSGKRRFCWLPCFNDPLESLRTFLSPDYLNANFTQAKVEWYIDQNATSWGTQEMLVQVTWGYWKPLEARVVALTLAENSGLAYQHQSIAHGRNKAEVMKKKSPPLGIPLASMHEMQEQYCALVREIVMDNPIDYVTCAYSGQASDLPRRLLQVVAAFYSAGLAAGDECESLREVLEVHVVETILERSLILNETSMRQVEHHLRQKFPPRSASRCMQRQIKLAFYEVQQQRIFKVLESWGAMMWTSNKNTAIDKKWAVSFSILITLILVVDKTLESAHWFCESQIRNYNANPIKERAKFHELVRLTQTELFERCKEIFHSSFKSRKGGKEACNPIRDRIAAFKGKTVNEGISRLVWDMDEIMREFGPEIKSHKGSRANEALHEHPYTNSGRLASIFLADFLDH